MSLLFIILGHKFREEIQLKLKQPLIQLPATTLDGWSVTHFLLFMLFGLIEPGYHMTFLFIGIAFEVFEDMLSADSTTQLFDCMDKDIKNHFFYGTLFCNGLNDDYWYGKWDDIFVNLIGYTLGSSLKTYVYK